MQYFVFYKDELCTSGTRKECIDWCEENGYIIACENGNRFFLAE